MNAFVNAARNIPVEARTLNGMKAQESTLRAVTDLFYNIGAMRGKQVVPQFERALQEDQDLALRVALWARDARGGAGERKLFRDILVHLEEFYPEILTDTKFLSKVPELGRWDDLLVFQTVAIKARAFGLIRDALFASNGLCAKWMPRKGGVAVELRNFLGLTPKTYRKTLVGLTNVVETPMCAKNYDAIDYSHVPSLAMSRYMKTFHKNDESRFVAYRNALVKGETKINASAVYPYDVIKSLRFGGDNAVCNEQWKALPDYIDDTNILPMVDVSGSMSCAAGGNPNLSCMDVALSLGLYCADKNKGAFKDMFLTFSESPELLTVSGPLSSKLNQMQRSKWGMNTNLHKAFDRVLNVAQSGKVPQEDMPQVVLILSDMQFDQCAKFDDSAMQMIERKYEAAGYTVPVIVFWNLHAYGNAPVSFDKRGVALVSGFSPAIMKAILGADLSTLTPESLVRDAVGIARYDYK